MIAFNCGIAQFRRRRPAMATNAISTPELRVNTEKIESCPNLTLKQRILKLLREAFEGHEEYLGVTPD
jgi:hypothetical protein